MKDLINAEEIIKMLNINLASSAVKQQHHSDANIYKLDKQGSPSNTEENIVIAAKKFIKNELLQKYEAVFDKDEIVREKKEEYNRLKIKVNNEYIPWQLSDQVKKIINSFLETEKLLGSPRYIETFFDTVTSQSSFMVSPPYQTFAPFGYSNSTSPFYNFRLPFPSPSPTDNFPCPPKWEYWLQDFEDLNGADAYKQFIGAIFSNVKTARCLYLVGEGGGGKSTQENVFIAYFNKNNKTKKAISKLNASAFDNANRFELANTEKSVLCFIDESEITFLPKYSKFKSFITEPTITIEEKGQQHRTIRNHNNVIISSNHSPTAIESQVSRRIIFLTRSLPKKVIVNFYQQLEAEVEQFIQHCIVHWLNTPKEKRITEGSSFVTETMERLQGSELYAAEHDFKYFDITGSKDEFLVVSDLWEMINQHRSANRKPSLDKKDKTRIKESLKNKNIKIHTKRIDGKVVECIFGIKPKEFQSF